MKISIYNENCVQAGRAVSEAEIERVGDGGGDWTTYEDTPEGLLILADVFEHAGIPSQYRMRCADTLRHAVYLERPDLEPEESDEDE